jgi:hypothetical protein
MIPPFLGSFSLALFSIRAKPPGYFGSGRRFLLPGTTGRIRILTRAFGALCEGCRSSSERSPLVFENAQGAWMMIRNDM